MMSQEQSGKKVFLAYIDDTDIKRQTYVYLISKNEQTITFRTKTSLITIPYSRVLKLKENLEGNEYV